MLNVQQKKSSKLMKNLIEIERNGSSDYIGIFLRHQQKFQWFDNDFNCQINYELNPKLFAINEPYLMKTERDSLIKLKQQQLSNDTKSSGPIQKRKKNFDKKIRLLDGNFASDEEKLMFTNLIEKYLNDDDKNNDDRSNVRKNLIKSIKLDETNSNNEAQKFVDSLFMNRFESLNYRTKLLCNPFSKTIKAKIGLSNFLIPPRCSFAGIDVIDGVKMLLRYLKITSIDSTPSSMKSTLICTRNPFVLIMDPAWDNNKSVKRKRTYETVSIDYMRRLCNETKKLIELIDNLRQSSMKKTTTTTTAATTTIEKPSIICAIWTTNLDKEFVINEMLPILNLRLSHVLKWHKITNNGLPVKVHGGQEFLILATTIKSSLNDDVVIKNGIIVSIPSAIHSHKPNIMPIIRRIFDFNVANNNNNNNNNCFNIINNTNNDIDDDDITLHCSMLLTNSNNIEQSSSNQKSTINNNNNNNNDDDNNNNHYWLITNEFINYICGIELFARNLQTGFHSIGYECIKLQNEKLFVNKNNNNNDINDDILLLNK